MLDIAGISLKILLEFFVHKWPKNTETQFDEFVENGIGLAVIFLLHVKRIPFCLIHSFVFAFVVSSALTRLLVTMALMSYSRVAHALTQNILLCFLFIKIFLYLLRKKSKLLRSDPSAFT